MADHQGDDETFIGEPIEPKPGSFDPAMMARGGPGIPGVFTWRGREYRVLGIIGSWTGREPGKGMDKEYTYIRKHFYRVKVTTGEVMTLYFDRKPPSGRAKSRQRWHLFSVSRGEPSRPSAG